jgi:molybdopterin molybdotransferase
VRVEWAEARRRAWAAAAPLPVVALPLAAAEGGTLAAPLRAHTPVPGFDCSAMDGYAVGSPAGPWRLVGRVLAGPAAARPPLGPGTAVEIATGAAVPAGTVAVLPYELATRAGEHVDGPAEPGRHVRRTGEDVPVGVDLLPAGAAVTPTVVGLAAEVGLDVLPVRPRPVVAALLTGDELVRSGGSGGGLVRDSVGPALPGWVHGLGGRLLPPVAVPDTDAATVAATIAAAGGQVVLTSGGAGGGPKDLVAAALAELGADLLVDRVDCRPGGPARLAALPDGRWVVALPGYPYAALVALLTLLGPLLAGLAGRPLPVLGAARPAGPSGAPGPVRIVPVRRGPDGTVRPVGRDRPGNLWGAADADALAVLPAGPTGTVRLLTLP